MSLAKDMPREYWKHIAGNQRFAGGQRIYTWRQLEPEAGRYDFSGIEADLIYLRRQSQRLILEVWDNQFLGEPIPPVPDYLLTPAYKGGIAYPEKAPKVVRTKRWVPAVMDRYLLLIDALGQRFDRDPYFAGLIHTETSMEKKGPGFEDFSGAAYDGQLRRMIVASRKAFPSTPVILFGNWSSYRGQEGLVSLGKCALEAGVGWGGPDLCPWQKTWGYDIIRSYPGQMPLGLAAQYESYKGERSVLQLLDFAIKDLKLNFVFWLYVDRHRSGGLSFNADVIPAVNAYPQNLCTERPANLALSSNPPARQSGARSSGDRSVIRPRQAP
jgi:hypothetical protein